jgi:hypothetical protein
MGLKDDILVHFDLFAAQGASTDPDAYKAVSRVYLQIWPHLTTEERQYLSLARVQCLSGEPSDDFKNLCQIIRERLANDLTN